MQVSPMHWRGGKGGGIQSQNGVILLFSFNALLMYLYIESMYCAHLLSIFRIFVRYQRRKFVVLSGPRVAKMEPPTII